MTHLTLFGYHSVDNNGVYLPTTHSGQEDVAAAGI